jgi:hypothetical protein
MADVASFLLVAWRTNASATLCSLCEETRHDDGSRRPAELVPGRLRTGRTTSDRAIVFRMQR